MLERVQQAHIRYQESNRKLESLRESIPQTSQQQTQFVKDVYFPQMVENYFYEKILDFEINFPMGLKSHRKAYLQKSLEKQNDFFFKKNTT